MKRPNQDLDQIWRDDEPFLEALRQAYRDAVRDHRAKGVPMVFWENGKVVEVPADQLEIDDPVTASTRPADTVRQGSESRPGS